MYDNFFAIKKIKLKSKDLRSPWITQGIKQSLYDKFLKNRTPENEGEYKDYKILFETIKKHSKFFSFLT